MARTPGATLRRRLRLGLPLRKHEGAQTSGRPPHRFYLRDCQRERVFLYAQCSRRGGAECNALALRVAECSEHAPCGNWMCSNCRHRHWQGVRKHAEKLCSGVPRAHLGFLTIVFGVVNDEDIGRAQELIWAARTRIRDCLKHWPQIRAIGRFEIDYLLPGENPGTFKTRTLSGLGWEKSGKGPALVVHLHAIMVFPGLIRQIIRLRLEKQFPGPRVCKFGAFYTKKEVSASLDNLIRYPLKHDLPAGALPSKGSRCSKPRMPKVIRFYARMIEELGGLGGSLEFRL